MKAEKITSSVMLNSENITIEEFVDDKKIENAGPTTDSTAGKKEDNTTVEGTIPKAGKDILIIVIAIVIAIIGKVAYSKYKDIKLN